MSTLSIDILIPSTIEDVRNLVLIVTAVIGLGLLVWRSIVAQKQVNLASRAHGMDRFQKGAEMLGSERVSIRLSGIIYLHALAISEPRRFGSVCMDVMEKMIKERCREEKELLEASTETTLKGVPTYEPVRSDIEFAVKKLTHLSNTFNRGVSLEGAHFYDISFSGLSFVGFNFDFCNFEFCHFIGTKFTKCGFDHASFKENNFDMASFGHCEMHNASFMNNDHTHSLTFDQCDIAGFYCKPPDELDAAQFKSCKNVPTRLL